MPGRFIVLEGPDGAGTTTHSALLAEKLKAAGHDVVLTAEPTGGIIGTFIRGELSKKTIPSPAALQLLFCADRAAHVDALIKPALAAGKTVVCDRYWLSTLVYGEAFGVDRDWLESINQRFPKPDLTILAMPGIEVCLKRVGLRDSADIFEKEDLQRRIYQLYEKAATIDSSLKVIDTSGSKEEVAEEIFGIASR